MNCGMTAKPLPLPFPTAVQWSHRVLETRLAPGMVAVDATAGNGHDTVFLAQRVLPGGKVYAFDVQAQAMESTRQRLAGHGFEAGEVALIHAGHETLGQHLPADLRGGIDAVMFNLGYLPGGDKTKITLLENTLPAVEQALDWLGENGVLSAVVYPGHAGGAEEAAAVEGRLAALSSAFFEVQKIGFLNYRVTTPFLLIVRKKSVPQAPGARQKPPSAPH